MKSVSLAVSVALLVAPALAWMETIRNAGRLSLPVMKASKDDEMIEAYRARLEHTYSPHGEYGTAGFFGGASHLRDPVSSPLRDSYGEWSDENTLPCGEDCEECEIPDEFRVTDVDPIDVLAYLQIRRAEPLRVERNNQSREWE